MRCGYPLIVGGRAFGCGQCFNCRVNQRRIWTHRLMLEAKDHAESCFVTLTYDEDHLPEDRSLSPDHLRNYLKRLRKKLDPIKLRYFACGEYGDKTDRPHYHLALFGTVGCRKGITAPNRNGECCETCDTQRRIWGYGNVFIGQLTEQSAAYIVGYVVKKITNPMGKEELAGRHPEFARMSNRPGIGAGFMDEVASTLLEHRLQDSLEDVPMALRHGKRVWPLGRYLRRRLRTRIGREPNAPVAIQQQMEEELRPVREAAFATAANGFKEIAFREALIAEMEGVTKRTELVHRFRNKGKYL